MSNPTIKILVVEDDPDLGLMIKMMLEFKKYSVIHLLRADDIENIFANNHINLVITDMLLSGTNGTDICRQLKKDPALSHIPVIMISAHPNAHEISMQAGADAFIAKPFEMNDLLNAVAGYLQKSKTVN
jgi:DNA-binding response OmpR family regulator